MIGDTGDRCDVAGTSQPDGVWARHNFPEINSCCRRRTAPIPHKTIPSSRRPERHAYASGLSQRKEHSTDLANSQHSINHLSPALVWWWSAHAANSAMPAADRWRFQRNDQLSFSSERGRNVDTNRPNRMLGVSLGYPSVLNPSYVIGTPDSDQRQNCNS